MLRLDNSSYFMSMAWLASLRGTCPRRQVGAILVNKRKHIIATGYNGPAAGVPHCLDTGGEHDRRCRGADAPSGTGLDLCEAIHAEMNALLQCKDVHDIEAIYTTAAPCPHCLKLLMNTSCKTVYFHQEYPGFNSQAWQDSMAGRQSVFVPVSKYDAAKFLCA